MNILIKTVVKYIKVLEYACHAVRGSVRDETSPTLYRILF